MKRSVKIIVPAVSYATIQIPIEELIVLKCALRAYKNAYGNSLLRRIEKAEELKYR